MKVKRIIAILLAAATVLSLAACSSWDKVNSKATYVYWLNFKPELDDVLQKLAAEYSKKKGFSVTVKTPEGDYDTALAEELNSDNPPTMFVLGKRNSVAAFYNHAADLGKSEIVKLLNVEGNNMYDEKNRLVAIPYCLECFGIAVNPYCLEVIGHSVDEIKDFDSLKTIVEELHSNAEWLGCDAFAPIDVTGDSSWKYTAHLANVEYAYEKRRAAVWDDVPPSLSGEYTDNFKNLYDLVVNNSTAAADKLTGGHNGLQDFKHGKAAFYLAGSWEFSSIAEEVPDAVMIPYYCGVAGEEKAGLCVGTENCWAINDNISEESNKATTDFMIWLMSDKKASAALVKELGPLPYVKASKTSENTFLNNAQAYEAQGCYDLPWAFTYQPNTATYRKELCDALAAYNADQSDANWRKVKDAMIDGWMRNYISENE